MIYKYSTCHILLEHIAVEQRSIILKVNLFFSLSLIATVHLVLWHYFASNMSRHISAAMLQVHKNKGLLLQVEIHYLIPMPQFVEMLYPEIWCLFKLGYDFELFMANYVLDNNMKWFLF